MFNALTIILRTCDKINAFSGTKPRDFGSKQEVMFKCIDSLKKSIDFFRENNSQYTVQFIIVDDHSSQTMVSFLQNLNPDKFISLEKSGNGESFVACLAEAKLSKGILFFVEDDYLFKETCIDEMVDIYNSVKPITGSKNSLCVYPSDYPDRYKSIDPSYIVLGKNRHWRSIKHTTCTFMIDDVILDKHYKNLYNFKNYGVDPMINEDWTINMMYKDYLCFSPIPSLAEHYQYKETISPFFKEK